MRDSGGNAPIRMIALVGNPNSGKTTLFNALTGLHQKVGNYPGVTVERKEGSIRLEGDAESTILDLPGTYSLMPGSPDEEIATEILLRRAAHTPAPDVVVCVVDASHLERNLYLVSQIIDQGLPVVIALNMIDVARRAGFSINPKNLSRELGVPVVPTVASKGEGVAQLTEAIRRTRTPSAKRQQWQLPEMVQKETEELAGILRHVHLLPPPQALHEAISLLTAESSLLDRLDRYAPEVLEHVRKDHQKLDFLGFERRAVFVESRYAWIRSVCASAVTRTGDSRKSRSDRIDAVLTHRVWGVVIFLALMALVFQAMFSWSTIPMDLIRKAFDGAGFWIESMMGPGDLRELIIHGGLAGVAAVVTFLPQILFLFLFLGLLEDTGYMARGALIMGRVMAKVGLSGKSFIPLLSSFACAIPGIMATRTIENPRDRIATILVAPLMSCSARLPVYALMIAAFIPQRTVLGVFSLAGITMFSMYFLGLSMALLMAWIFKNSLLRGAPPVFIIELPPYHVPSIRSLLQLMWERSRLFLRQAGTVILGASIVLWFLATYPKTGADTPAENLNRSFVGMAGHAIEPLIRPLGFDWKIGVGMVTSLIQREVFVSTMATMYNVQSASGGTVSLPEKIRQERNPETGAPSLTALTGICVMVYYVLAMQCFSTVAVVRRETNSWRWPLFQIG
ncbi:MAG TPA: ferrous iron transport protein B, partial [Bacteroidota bacterium]|nr:ferrous iron transport protein B [Bacteroidota bacterium]